MTPDCILLYLVTCYNFKYRLIFIVYSARWSTGYIYLFITLKQLDHHKYANIMLVQDAQLSQRNRAAGCVI